MSNKKTRHHFVSQFYLEGFIDPDNPPFLWLYDKDKQTIVKASTKDAGCRTLFYSFPKQDGTVDTNTLEDIFGNLESEVAPLFRKIESREELSNDERSAVSYYLALALTRVPNFRSNIESHHAQVLREIGMLMARKNGFEQIKDKLAKEGKPVDEELHAKMVEIMKKGEFDVQVSPHYSIDHFLRMTVELAPILHKMYWTYLFAKGRYRFITSDNPVSYADPTHDPKALHGVGLATRNVEVTFPVTQEMAIFASWDDGGNLYQRATEATVRAINVRTIANARRFVYSSFPDEGFAKLVWEYTGTAPTAKLEVLHKEDRSFLIFKGTALKDQANIKQLAYGSTRR